MRLTLRTMLAYLDDVLDPADSHELEHKIEESSFASGLVSRVRDSMRRMRLGAPKLDGRGLGLDPNTVADYLDSTLAPERVPDFEKVCLESDVHLAEVASCHQVLTLVLGEPAQVDASMRERVYRIGHADSRQLEQAASASGNGATSAVSGDGAVTATAGPRTGTGASRADSQRALQMSPKSLAVTVLLGFLIALVALQAIGVNKLRGWVGLSSPRKVVDSSAPAASDPLEPEITIPSGADSRSTESRGADEVPGVESPSPAAAPAKESRPVSPSESPVKSQPALATEEASPASPEVKTDLAAKGVEVGEIPSSGEVVAPGKVAAGEIADGKMEESSESSEVSAVEPSGQIALGLYISEEQVLARYDDAAGDWFRVVPDAPLLTGQRIIALPTYRPQLLLSPNIKFTLAGETHLQLEQTNDAAGPLVKIESGRAIMMPLGDSDSAVHLEAAGRAGSVLFADADSALAVEVMKYLPPGQRPELEPAIPIIQLFAISGRVTWQEKDSEEFVVTAGQVLTMEGEGLPGLYDAGELPTWVVGKDLADIDQLASAELRRDLETDRPLSLSLLERTGFRQVEVRSLASRSLCSLDMFDPAIEALDGARLRSYWYAQFDALRGALARNPESAIKLQRSLEKLTSDDAGLMYELLCGFNPDQLAAGGAKKLVDALEHERVSTRVLAYENLRRITDKTQLFRPEQPPTQQKGEVMKWRRNLDSGAIVYQHPPMALPARAAVTEEPSGESPDSE